MHDDPVLARRTVAGGQVVHGVHQALASLEAVLAYCIGRGITRRGIMDFEAVFKKPVLMGETVGFYLTEFTGEGCQVAVKTGDTVVSKISIRWGADVPSGPIGPRAIPGDAIIELPFDKLQGRTGSLELGLDMALAGEMFPLALSALGPLGMAEVLSLSRLVGMHCPGLHSVFRQFAIHFSESGGGRRLNYRVDNTDERFGEVTMEVTGPRIRGKVTAFFRTPPTQQPSMAELAGLVEPLSLQRTVAMIIGGSRGLGEVTARIIAAGGGLPIITYNKGADDAERIAADIRSAGGRCELLQLDVRDRESALRQWPGECQMARSLYYFATPRIFGRRHGFFDHDLLREFNDFYVTGFGRLIDHVAAGRRQKLRVLYPSSIAVTESSRELAEYAVAKSSGEEMCKFYNRHSKELEILVVRLPRIRTDQTSTIVPVHAEDGLTVMLPLVQRIEAPLQE